VTDIVEFLTARLDEEEARQQRLVYSDTHWESLETSACLGSWTYSREHGITVATNDAIIAAGLARMRETLDNWQRQNAKQWLADVAAKREVVEQWRIYAEQNRRDSCDPEAGAAWAALCLVLVSLAGVHREHPDYAGDDVDDWTWPDDEVRRVNAT
jgi:hypothetical protein